MKKKKLKNGTLSVFQMLQKFPTELSAIRYLEEKLWPAGPTCPDCGQNKKDRIYLFNDRPSYYRCKDCFIMFSVTIGTIFENGKMDIRKWMYAIYLISRPRKVSAEILAEELAIGLPCAKILWHKIYGAIRIVQGETWFVLHKQYD